MSSHGNVDVRRLPVLLAPVLCLVLILFAGPLLAAVKDSACISCHEKPANRETKEDKKEVVHFSRQELNDSVHKSLGCLECHTDISTLPHKKALERVDCARCHQEASLQFGRGIHGVALKRADKDAPSCTSCHGNHRILRISDQRSPVNRANQVMLCARCHTDVEVQKKHNLPSGMVKAYENSVHGRFLKEGSAARAAVCSDCHRAHLILGPKDPDSSTNRVNMGEVCGRCHVQIYNEYKVSIHGKALKEGKMESPTCTDCHGEHTLTLVNDPQARVYAKNIPTTCAKCHENQEIIRKYRLPSDRYSSYVGSFHGVAMKYGNVTAANCTSCHETHRILPATDPESSINEQNLPRTCGKCHPTMKNVTSIGKVHVEATKGSSLGMYYVRNFYTWFIGLLMLLFVGYIVLDVYGRVKRRGKRND
ncbi:MAG: cytochrome c3 family protein [Syntrophorhabdales bacterium]